MAIDKMHMREHRYCRFPKLEHVCHNSIIKPIIYIVGAALIKTVRLSELGSGVQIIKVLLYLLINQGGHQM